MTGERKEKKKGEGEESFFMSDYVYAYAGIRTGEGKGKNLIGEGRGGSQSRRKSAYIISFTVYPFSDIHAHRAGEKRRTRGGKRKKKGKKKRATSDVAVLPFAAFPEKFSRNDRKKGRTERKKESLGDVHHLLASISGPAKKKKRGGGREGGREKSLVASCP